MAVTRKVRRFSGGVYDLGLHVVWCPKYRRPVLDGRVAERLDELIRQKADERGWEIVALEVVPDHVHLFVKHDPKSSASSVANQFKGFTSHVLRGIGRSRLVGHRAPVHRHPVGTPSEEGRRLVIRAYKFLPRPTARQAVALGWSFSSQQATPRRLDKAFKAFFRRVKAGRTPGCPRLLRAMADEPAQAQRHLATFPKRTRQRTKRHRAAARKVAKLPGGFPPNGAAARENRVTQDRFQCTARGFAANADHVGATNVLNRAGLVLCVAA